MKRPRGPPPGIPPRDGAAPYVAAFAWGALEGRWRERYASVCTTCFNSRVPCGHFPELPLRCLIVGHNPSTHAFASGFAYSNPTNRLLALVNGTFSGGPPYEGLLPAWADFPYQDWAPLHRGVGFSDLGVEPGNDAAAYDHATLLRWRDELFASVAGHMRRVGAGLQTLAAVAATAAGDGGSGGGGASSSSAAARPSPSSTAAMSGGSGNKRRRAITAADEVTSSYFSATAASVTATATASSSSSAAASSSSSAAAAVTVSSSVTSSAAAAPFVCTALDGVPPPVARAVLAAVARRAGLASWRQLSAAQLASPAVTAPRYIAFAGKAEWKFLFDPPLRCVGGCGWVGGVVVADDHGGGSHLQAQLPSPPTHPHLAAAPASLACSRRGCVRPGGRVLSGPAGRTSSCCRRRQGARH